MRFDGHATLAAIAMLTLRPYQLTDAPGLWTLFRDTVHRVNCRDYSQAEVQAWAPPTCDLQQWAARFEDRIAYVAELQDVIVGFIDLSHTGYLDRLFVSADHQRQGIARALLSQVVREARRSGIPQIVTHASITARHFFAAHGFSVQQKQQVRCRGVLLTNFRMTLPLPPRDSHGMATE
jgi:putative acetyltransferase